MGKKKGSATLLKRGIVRANIEQLLMEREGFFFSHNIRVSDTSDKNSIYPTLDEEYKNCEERYGRGNFKFGLFATLKGGGKIPEKISRYYHPVYIKYNHKGSN